MSGQFISSSSIQKLVHRIPEIRERALFSIISKLENGFTFDNDLARSKDLLYNLFQWFLFEPCTNEHYVLKLIKTVLLSPSGSVLISHLGKQNIQQEIEKIKTYIDPKFLPKVNDILGLLETTRKIDEPRVIIPPLAPDVPLSYRSNLEDNYNSPQFVGETASSIKGQVQKDSSYDQEIGFQQSSRLESLPSDKPTYRLSDNKYDPEEAPSSYIFKWQPLIETDRNVLLSVEKSIKNPQSSSVLYHSCEFFLNVLLHDFPAEVFIQRPGIITAFYELLYKCRSAKLSNIILHCFYDLTKSLSKRINYCNDPCMRNLKVETLTSLVHFCTTSSSDGQEQSSKDYFEFSEETKTLKSNQFFITNYCFRTMNIILKCLDLKKGSLNEFRPKLDEMSFNMCLILLDELVSLLYQAVGDISCKEAQQTENLTIYREINNTLSLFGDILEYFRIESLTSDSNLECRAIYLFLLFICAKFLKNLIPPSKLKLILPRNFKLSLSNSLLDISLGRLYPKIHQCLLAIVENFSTITDGNCLKKYENVMDICNGLTATVTLLRGTDSNMDAFRLASAAIPSIEFHRNLEFLTVYVDLCAGKLYAYRENHELLRLATDTILQLLAHRLPEIREEMYVLCHKTVIEGVGTKFNFASASIPGSRIFFLLQSKIFNQLAVFGIKDELVRHYAEDILLYIIKSQMVVADEIWEKCIEALIPSLPLMICYAENSTTLGRTIINILDPDACKELHLPDIVMLKGNIELLFSKETIVREEGFSRLCWLLAKQENSRDILPKFNTIYDRALSNVCNIKKVLDVNKIRKSDHFYQASSLHQVMELLKSENVEPVIRRSALNQVSVMMEDPLLHEVFLESSGVELMIDIMVKALNEHVYSDYPDSVIPAVSVLKNLALFHSSVRESIGFNSDVFYYTLRGLFLFLTEDRMQQDGSILLFLLVFKDYLIGSPSLGDFAIPSIVNEKLLNPFISNTHLNSSAYTRCDLYSEIIQDKWSLSSLQIQWNADVYNGFDNLIKLDEADLRSENDIIETNDVLCLKPYDLKQVKTSSVHFCIKQYLFAIQSATSLDVIEEVITRLTLYVHCYNLISQISDSQTEQLLSHPWEQSFIRYLAVLPSSEEDISLLNSVVKFLIILIPLYKDSEACWIVTFFKSSSHSLLDLLTVERFMGTDIKALSQDLLNLITLCIIREHHYLDYSISGVSHCPPKSDWQHVIRIISDNLRFNNTQHFYNLAYLDSLLSCLVHLTARLGWSQTKAGSLVSEPIPQLICNLCELLTAFHCGKGATATVSMMGLSISRNVLLILNHLLAEIHYFKMRKWERCFFDQDDPKMIKSFLAMWASRDVILRAAALQFFNNLTKSSVVAEFITNSIKNDGGNVWELILTVITDHTEAGIVRENAALLLANLCNHESLEKGEVMKILDEFDFYSHYEIILTSLFTLDCFPQDQPRRKTQHLERNSSENGPREYEINISTPGFIKAVCTFLCNLSGLVPKEICDQLQDKGLVKLTFRALSSPSISVSNKKELALYCNILEMNTSICTLLKRLCTINFSCVGTILHTKDCLNMLISLLNSKMFDTHLPELVYLRNGLWNEIYSLISTLLEAFNRDNISPRSVESLSTVANAIEETGTEAFLETLCESIGCIGTDHLQNSSLVLLISMLRIECGLTNKLELLTSSLENILDNIRAPKTIVMSSPKDNLENRVPLSKNQRTLNLLEEAYFGKQLIQKTPSVDEVEISIIDSSDDALIVGGEFCKILLFLYELINIKTDDSRLKKKKSLVISALTGLLCVSNEAKKYALNKGFLEMIMKELRDYHIKLSLESVDNLRRVQDKKRLTPLLTEINDIIGMLTNFMLNNAKVKTLAATLNLADVVHKLWVWFCLQNTQMVDVLRMICVYTLDCPEACKSMPLTSPIAGSGPRKTPTNVSLLHAIISLVNKEMEQISRSHDLQVLELAFDILQHCSELLECRVVMSKSNLFQGLCRLHPAATKKQVPWDSVELLWLEFLQTFTRYPEGQTAVAKGSDTLDLIIVLTNSPKDENRIGALNVLRNLTFYQPNRPRLLASGDFLNVLQLKLAHGNREEKRTIVAIMWALAANNQKAKLVFKSAKLDLRLENTIKCQELLQRTGQSMENEDLELMYLVLSVLRGADKRTKSVR